MLERNLTQYSKLSPFELKDQLIEIASSDAQRLMLNAGRGNPNFLATLPRWAFLSLGDFALRESDGHIRIWTAASVACRSMTVSCSGSTPTQPIIDKPMAYAFCGQRSPTSKISWAYDQDAFLFEMVSAFLGSTYPTPPRMRRHAEEIVKAYLKPKKCSACCRPAANSRCLPPKAALRR